MKDGVYRVSNNLFTAGFVVEDGKVTQCAPILRKLLMSRWVNEAELVDFDPDDDRHEEFVLDNLDER